MEIKRLIANDLCDDLFDKHAAILIGARQVGKTFLLRKVADYARQKGLATAFFDLEQPQDLEKFVGNEAEVIKFITGSGEVVFIDEFHYLKNASRIFKAIYDSGKKVKIYASGSSSIEIHKHLKESMAGRKFIYKIFPCSLGEMKQVIKENPFEYYCRFGGMPGIIHLSTEDKKKMYLADILQSYLLKDIKSLIKEENIRAFNHLIYLLAQYQGSVVSTSGLANEVGMSSRTIESYLEMMAQTYVCFPLNSFSSNYGNELKKSKKYYLYDLGIRNALLKNFDAYDKRADPGTIVESFVFNELQKQLSVDSEIRFWRTKNGDEVDFIWIKNQKPHPIEVKTSIKLGEIPKGLNAFLNRYPNIDRAFVVNRDTVGEFKTNNTVVVYKKWEDSSTIPMLV